MKERPILMSGPMVREILAGNKTQTRRPIKPGRNQKWLSVELLTQSTLGYLVHEETFGAQFNHPQGGPLCFIKCPHGQPGDQLWLKEGYYAFGWWNHTTTAEGKAKSSFVDVTLRGGHEYIYQTEDPPGEVLKGFLSGSGWYKRNSLFMPRIASRINLEIEYIGVQRLHNISEDDAKAEGVKPVGGHFPYVTGFFRKWVEIYGQTSFDSNPWVWAIAFKRVKS
jgi:hypothetical protein